MSKTEAEYEDALRQIYELLAEIEIYEEKHYPIGAEENGK